MPRRICCLLGCALALLAIPPAAAGAATFNVTTSSDSNSGTCLPASCTLRQAVEAADAGASGNTINAPAGRYTLVNGELQLQKDVTINGEGPAATVIDGNAMSRIFSIPTSGVTVQISGLAVENGQVAGTSAAEAQGGGIFNAGMLTLENVLVRGNAVVPATSTPGLIPEGGGIFNSGTLHIAKSAIEGNSATTLPNLGGIPQGAGIANESGQVDLTDSVLSGNSSTNDDGIPEGGGLSSSAMAAHGAGVTLIRVKVDGNRVLDTGTGGISEGGGISAFRTDVSIRESTLMGNLALGGAIAEGGALDFQREGNFALEESLVASNVAEGGVFADAAGLSVSGETTEVQRIVNSTITGNTGLAPSGASGSGIIHSGAAPLDVLSSTISANVASGAGANDHGGNLVDFGASGSVLSLRDSIVSGGAAAGGSENCAGSGVQSEGHNIDSMDQCNFHAAGDKVNANPLLAPLADNGGLTETLALTPGSPAIDAGDTRCPATDQRGVVRPQGGACDIGAFELQVPPSVVPVPITAHSACIVPKLKGKSLKASKKKLKKADCKLGKVKKLEGVTAKTGKVKKQSPKPDKVLAPGAKVNLKLGG